jgi:hypothetical protein
MAIHLRPTPLLAVIGVLTLGGASAARAQDTSAAARSDTSGYQTYQDRNDTTQAGQDTAQAGQDTTRSDTSGFKYTGPETDTTLKAQPGVQTGPSGKDSGAVAESPTGISAADTVVCKDGSNAANQAGAGCREHGGIDSVATTAALKARGWQGHTDTSAANDTSAASDTSSSSQQQSP